ncbi:hypothetical protein MTR67_028781 [Solanum verrucosum]|uniref:SRF-type transcription factor family protein n=1 Tax=Solanum verrucosum TaxID=315347 RepID=A0AAF0RBP9_SOLVR|nr:hypothetical protein MTR67_028781 [Solanum verrucosum]
MKIKARRKQTNNPKSYQERMHKEEINGAATLCDIKVCTVITGPNGELQTWPVNLDACKEVLDLYSQNLKPGKKHKESSTPVPLPGEEQGEKDLLTLVESKLAAVNRRIRFWENMNVAVADKGKIKSIE